MVTALRATRAGGQRLGWLALAAALLGEVAAFGVILGSQDDLTDIVWPIVVAPAAIASLPLLVPATATRIVACLSMTTWCLLGAASIGLFLVPSCLLLIAAAWRAGS